MPRRPGSPAEPPSASGGRHSAGRYVIADRIATGGMAAVHLAHVRARPGDTGAAPPVVAVKRLHAHHAEDARFVAMFLEEARMAARIRHPNVVAPHDIVQSGAELLLIMEYVHGASLSTLMRSLATGARVPLPIVSAIVVDALHGLAAAHDARGEDGGLLHLVHRDVSPQNLMVGADGITRVIDFGIAKARGRDVESSTGSVKGKFAYMAPEQLRGRAVSHLADVYAVGVLLWELLTGRRLFEGSDGEVVEQVLLGEAPHPSVVATDVPYALGEVVMAALAYEPEARPLSAELFAQSLSALVVPASRAQVASWVESLVGPQLAERGARVEALARGEAADLRDASREGLEPSNGGSRSTRGRGLRRQRVAVALALTVAFAAAVAGARNVVRGRQPSPAPTAAGHPEPAASVEEGARGSDAAALAGMRPEAAPSVDAKAPPSPVPSERVQERARPRRPAPAAAPAAKPKRDVRVECTPPYVIDEVGRKIYKRDCLR